MDPSVQIAMTSIVGLIVTAVLGWIGAAITAKLNRAEKDREAAEVRRALAEKEAAEKLAHIEHLANSTLSTTTERLNEAMAQIKTLTDMMAAQQMTAQDKLVAEMRSPTTVPIQQAAEAVAEALNSPMPRRPASEVPRSEAEVLAAETAAGDEPATEKTVERVAQATEQAVVKAVDVADRVATVAETLAKDVKP